MKQVLMGLSTDELRQVVTSLGMPRYAADQIARRMYINHALSIDEITELSKRNRALLAERYEIGAMPPVDSMRSIDGTEKYLFPTSSGHYVEAVFIPEKERGTLCVSCQVGCRMGCAFCATGRQGFEGNLTVGDIINQVYSLPERERLTNIVFMGQGEPMDNIDNVLAATRLLTSPSGYAWSPRRITVSSVGIRRNLKRFLDESECHVAVSMHAPTHELRHSLMPAEGVMSIAEVVDLLKSYDFSGQRRLSFEYIVFDGLNDSLEHAREIVKLVGGLRCRMNLIRFHAIPDSDLRPADIGKMTVMRDFLTRHGVFTTIRASRGEDILAACGLLSTKNRRLTN